MQKKDKISPEDLNDIRLLEQITREVSLSIKIIHSFHSRDQSSIEGATLIIFCGDNSEALHFLGDTHLPESIPILFLGREAQIVDLVNNIPVRNYIDFLPLPVSIPLFLHKLRSLILVYRLALEQQNQATTLHQQLNIFHNRDGLTGLYSRRHLTDQLQLFMDTARGEDRELSLLILNIDYFNNINKSYGLEFGDFLLNSMAARLTSTTPENATCYRFSGEDFVVLLPDTNLNSAIKIAEDINKICSQTPFWDGIQTASITLSAGVSSLQSNQPNNQTEFLCMAETAMYGAKANGRNRVLSYSHLGEGQSFTSQNTLAVLKENLSKILERTRNSAIASLQLLTSNVADAGHQEHITMVSEYLDLFAEHLGLPEHYTQTFKNSIALYSSFRCLLHKDIYSKPGKLTPAEKRIIQDLPYKLNELVDMFDYFSNERSVLLGHCERYDGSGYPSGLEKDEIPLGARIFHIVDALAAMNGERPYRRKLTPDEILEELLSGAGSQFDPHLVAHVFALIERHQILSVDAPALQEKQEKLYKNFPELNK